MGSNANTKIDVKKFFGVFKFGVKEHTFEGDLPLWNYFVEIEAPSGLEAIRLMTVNFGSTWERVFTEEQFTDEIQGFYPFGLYCKLFPKRPKYYVLSSEVMTYAVQNDLKLPYNWTNFIQSEGSPDECCSKANDPRGDMLVVSDGELVLMEWLRRKDHFVSKWVPQKF